jgi:TolB-like protein/DNA-binding winged helix-turn-helix (wHTH) protein/Tfp pilus assembly protein PilF
MPKSSVIRFGPFTADLDSGELRREGVKVRLQSQPFQLLTILLLHPGKVVTRDEIRGKLWAAETFVDFDHSLGTAINKIRAALRDSAEQPQFIETLPKRGYRFIGKIEVATEAQFGPSLPDPTKDPSTQNPASSWPKTHAPIPRSANPSWLSSRLTRRLLAGAAVLCIVLGASAAYSRHSSSAHKTSVANFQSVAVLPLSNLSSSPEEIYFADGMTDELITNLAKIRSLRVISRTSVMRYRDAHKSVPEIARELGVDGVVEGTVLRADGKIRITAQLIDGATDRHLWAEEYQRDARDVLTMQSEIARDIAGRVNARITSEEQLILSTARPVDPAVGDLYWKAVYFMTKATIPDFKRAEGYFEQIVHADPSNARAWAGVAMADHHLGIWGNYDVLPRAKAAALKAIELDDSLAEAHTELAMLSFLYDWNIAKAEQEFHRALALNPQNYPRTHVYHALMLAHLGRWEEAIAEIEQARRLDPLSSYTATAAGHIYYYARRYDDSLRVLKFALDLDPAYEWAHWRLGSYLEFTGEYEKALEEFGLATQTDVSRAGSNGDLVRLKRSFETKGSTGYWRESLAINLERWNSGDHTRIVEIARTYMHLGDREHAIEWLQRGYAIHNTNLHWWLAIQPEFDPIRSDPRVQKLLRELRLSS